MPKKKKVNRLDRLSEWLTKSIGTNTSIAIHSLLFVGIFALTLIGFSIDEVLLLLTTAVSLEAIYLAIFIQMTVNKTTKSLANVEEDIDDLQEDVDSLETNVKEISDDYLDDDLEEDHLHHTLRSITDSLNQLQKDIENLKTQAIAKKDL